MTTDSIDAALSSEDEDDATESVTSNSTGDNDVDSIFIENSIDDTIKRLNYIHDKCDKEKVRFLEASNELLEHVEAISDGVPCDQQQYIDVANCLNIVVNAFLRSQRLYHEMNDIVVEQTNAKTELKRRLEARLRPMHLIKNLLTALKKKIEANHLLSRSCFLFQSALPFIGISKILDFRYNIWARKNSS